MTTDWIEVAMAQYAELTAYKNVEGKYQALMQWREGEPIVGEWMPSLFDALDSLNTALREDASDEMRKDGKA